MKFGNQVNEFRESIYEFINDVNLNCHNYTFTINIMQNRNHISKKFNYPRELRIPSFLEYTLASFILSMSFCWICTISHHPVSLPQSATQQIHQQPTLPDICTFTIHCKRMHMDVVQLKSFTFVHKYFHYSIYTRAQQ